jgi:Zn-dependent protease
MLLGETPARCPECGTDWASGLVVCPGCRRLVHAERLRRLAAQAEDTARAGDRAGALAAWRSALELLPAGSRQHAQVGERIAALNQSVEAGPSSSAPAPPPGSTWARILAPLGVVGLVLWKFKFVAVFVLTKAKLLVVGLTKAPTLLSALASFGVYWTAWGWKFALGVVATMYVHEMGHVFALRQYGIRATAPMFVPGLGAFVRMQQYPASPREDARVGLAGPQWGLFAGAATGAVALAMGWPAWAAVTRATAWLNLLNLIPLGPLDGGRGFRTLTRGQRWLATGALAAASVATGDGLLVLGTVCGAARAAFGRGSETPDAGATVQYVVLVLALAVLGAASARSTG